MLCLTTNTFGALWGTNTCAWRVQGVGCPAAAWPEIYVLGMLGMCMFIGKRASVLLRFALSRLNGLGCDVLTEHVLLSPRVDGWWEPSCVVNAELGACQWLLPSLLDASVCLVICHFDEQLQGWFGHTCDCW